MNKIRKLNDEGFKKFIEFLKSYWRGSDVNKGTQKPSGLKLPFTFHDDKYSYELDNSINISDKPWEDSNMKIRFAIAKHIHELNIKDEDLDDQRLWAWLSIFYWDKLVDSNNWLNRVEHYVPIRNTKEKAKVNKHYKQETLKQASSLESRHNIFGPYMIYRIYGDDGNLFINSKPTEMGDNVEQPFNRKWLRAYKRIFLDYLEKHFKNNNDLTISFSTGAKGNRLITAINNVNYAYNLSIVSLTDFPKLINNKSNPEFPV